MTSRPRRALLRLLPFLALAAGIGLFLAPLAASGRALVFRDLLIYAAPQDALLREAILERHELPARDPYLYGGVDHLADPSTQSLYPPRLATALLFAAPRSLHVYACLHLLLAAAGAFLFGRALGGSRPAALAGALVYALSGPVLSLLENPPLLAGAAWLPFAPALALRARGARTLVLLAGAIGVTALAGDLQAATWSGLLAASILAWKSRGVERVTRPALTILLALALAGALLVPSALLRPKTDRASGLDEAEAGRLSLAPARVVELLTPFPWGHTFPEGLTIVDGLEPAGSTVTEPWCETIHVGLAGLVLGLVAVADPSRRRRVLVLAGLGTFALLAAMGPRVPFGPWSLLRALVPFYGNFRYPEKHATLLALAAAGLAALGVDAVRTAAGRARAAPVLLAGAALIALPGLALEGTIARALSAVEARAHRPFMESRVTGLAARIVWEDAPRAAAPLLALGFILLLTRNRRHAALAAALLVALDAGFALRPRLFLGDARLYDEHPIGADLVRASGCRVLRWPWRSAQPIGRVPSAASLPGRTLAERQIAGKIASWTGAVAARERVPALNGFVSFVPKATLEELATFPSPERLDALSVRFLVVDASTPRRELLLGDAAVVASQASGVLLLDRGERVPRAPATTFSGEVPGLLPGTALSLAGLAAAIALARRRKPLPLR
jgi:hypothetical protein